MLAEPATHVLPLRASSARTPTHKAEQMRQALPHPLTRPVAHRHGFHRLRVDGGEHPLTRLPCWHLLLLCLVSGLLRLQERVENRSTVVSFVLLHCPCQQQRHDTRLIGRHRPAP